MQQSKKGVYCVNNNKDVIKSFYMSDASDDAVNSVRVKCEEYCLSHAACEACAARTGGGAHWARRAAFLEPR